MPKPSTLTISELAPVPPTATPFLNHVYVDAAGVTVENNVVVKPGNNALYGEALITTVGNAFTVKRALLDITTEHGAAPVIESLNR